MVANIHFEVRRVVSRVGRASSGWVSRRSGRAALVAAVGALVVAAPAGAAVPSAAWYWSVVVPGSNSNVIVLATSGGLYRSTDGGTTWRPSGLTGVDATSLARVGSTILAAGVRVAKGTGPVLVVHGNYVVSPGSSVFATSSDGGVTWQLVTPQGLPSVGVQALAVDPSNDQVVDAVLRNGALYGSTDGGRSFTRVAAKVGGTPWAVAITQNGHLVAGNMTSGNYLSANAKVWQRTAFIDPRGSAMVMEYAVDPSDPSRVLMTSYGVLLSTNSGASWGPALKSKVMFGPVAWAPVGAKVAYAVGWDRSIWRSSDGGATWKKIG
jgi:photosystem II stability/assembly factor-like uncharacterized protein